ncbi:MAG: copper chaperone PCu(A)C [Bdellovibrio sp.]|nr:copper chaperone PCu(A)C [Methylotenera sp.]
MTRLIKLVTGVIALTLLLTACEVNNRVAIMDSWARANAPGQSVGAAYMTFISADDSTFIRAETPIASSVEIHSMTMNDGVMKMRMLPELPLKAGVAEKLAPGGFHLMLFDLKKPLIAGEQLDLTLTFRDATGKVTQQKVTLTIKEAN